MALLRFAIRDSRLTPVAAVLLSVWASSLHSWDVRMGCAADQVVRSLNDFHMDHLANPGWLSSAISVTAWARGVSNDPELALLAVGYGLKHPQWKDAGWQSLIAHGLAALSSNILKHAIGRPAPSSCMPATLSFPGHRQRLGLIPVRACGGSIRGRNRAGHKFPRVRWPILATAVAIAASRIIRGSHYLTDVAGGAALGCVMG